MEEGYLDSGEIRKIVRKKEEATIVRTLFVGQEGGEDGGIVAEVLCWGRFIV